MNTISLAELTRKLNEIRGKKDDIEVYCMDCGTRYSIDGIRIDVRNGREVLLLSPKEVSCR